MSNDVMVRTREEEAHYQLGRADMMIELANENKEEGKLDRAEIYLSRASQIMTELKRSRGMDHAIQ